MLMRELQFAFVSIAMSLVLFGCAAQARLDDKIDDQLFLARNETNSVPGSDSSLKEPFSEHELQWGKSITRNDCAHLVHAAWVEHRLGTECIRYYPSSGLEDGNLSKHTGKSKVAVVFFHGDHLAGHTPLGNYGKITPQSLLNIAQKNYRSYKIPYILVARPGVYGSSGNHGERRRPKEFHSLNAAVDVIKQRFGLEQVVLAGQSGGSTAAMALLTLGRTDIKCVAAGSGNYSVNALAAIKLAKMGKKMRHGCDSTGYCDAYDVIDHINGIVPDTNRPIYLIGDPQDQNTVFELQHTFYQKLKVAGHNVTLIEAEGHGPEQHSTAYAAYRVAGLCAHDLVAM